MNSLRNRHNAPPDQQEGRCGISWVSRSGFTGQVAEQTLRHGFAVSLLNGLQMICRFLFGDETIMVAVDLVEVARAVLGHGKELITREFAIAQ